MSQTYIAAIVALLSGLLPLAGLQVEDSAQLTNIIFNAITLGAGAWALYRRVRVGDISWTGIRKS